MNQTITQEHATPKNAWVVFTGQADLAWLKILKPGFRHCSVLLNDGEHWISYDPLSNYTDLTVHPLPANFDLPRWMSERGHTVLPAPMARPQNPAPLGFLTCVEAVKRVLGVHKRFIFTPWQLYRHLTKNNFAIKGELAWEV